jgi:thiamine-phosphate pyrophosphorylase
MTTNVPSVAEAVRLSPQPDETLTRSATKQLVVISPEAEEPREIAVLGELFAAGLERYHVRKPHWSAAKLEVWLRSLPLAWRSRLVLHQHHELVDALALGGRHWRDDGSARSVPQGTTFASRSCHDLATLRASLGYYDTVFFSPVFPSLSKPGHGLQPDISLDELAALLAARTATERRTTVIALGGITGQTASRALALGFDGVAALGAIWQAADPVAAFAALQNSLTCHAA